MHANEALVTRLYTALGKRDDVTMASCYHPDARFHDIAFDLPDRRFRIKDMWRMICSRPIKVEIKSVEADDRTGRARIVDKYVFGGSDDPDDPGRPVTNEIESRFEFRDGLILVHQDFCDAKEWARLAVGGIGGFLGGRFRFLRSLKAKRLLAGFIRDNPE